MIKSQVRGNISELQEFPMIRVADSGLVVLFQDENKGVVLDPGHSEYDTSHVGRLFNNWIYSDFKPWRGTVTLTQD